MKRSTVALVGISLLVAVGAAGIVASAEGVAGAPGGAAEEPFGQMDIEADDVLMEATVEPDGDAVWTIEYRTRLATDEDERAFEDLREDVDADPESYTDRFRERMETTVNASAEATGREMAVSNVTVTAERRDLPREYGVLTYEFRWSGFAVADGSRVVAGDALDGLFLDDETAFIVSWPETHQLVDATPSPTETRERSVVWVGPIDFAGEEPRVTVDSDAAPSDDDGAGGGGDGTENGGDGTENGGDGSVASSWVVVLGLGALLAALAIGFVAYRRRSTPADGSHPIRSGSLTGSESAGSESATPQSSGSGSSEPAESTSTGSSSGSNDESVSDPETAAGSDGEESTAVDTELLSNEEQVLRLIEEHGGRMKQAQVADELDWTAAKTSQVVTGLRDDGDLDGFRLGRENVLSLPESDE